MTQTVTRTVVATLLEPTANKEAELQSLVQTYREAFHDAFDAKATTQYEVNEIVTPYDLTAYAKDALKQHIPRLRNQYDAKEASEDQPVRLTSRGVQFDHSSERTHEFCVRIPRPGRQSNIWIPLEISPAQRESWLKIANDERDVGEVRLQSDEKWRLSVPIKRTVEHADDVPIEERTPVGFDIGESNLLVGCACKQETPVEPLFVNGGRARQLRKELHTTHKRLQSRNAASWRFEERHSHIQNALTDIIEKASREAIEYARQFDEPLVVLEDLEAIRDQPTRGAFLNRRLHRWAFARLQARIEDKAVDAGITVEYVNPAYTSQTCHHCRRIGSRNSQAEFRCTNEECWVTTYQADLNAAINIARRVDPWGENCRVKSDGDDMPRDGRTGDSATGQRT